MFRATTAALCLLFAATLVAEDSPLVALAKRTNKSKPKSKVITNETLSKSGGRVATSTEKQPPLPAAPSTTSTASATTQAPAQKTAAAAQEQTTDTPAPVPANPREPRWVQSTPANAYQAQNSSMPVSTQQPKPVESPYKATAPESSNQSTAPASTNKPVTPDSAQSSNPPQ